MTCYYSTFETPLGPFSVAVGENQAVVATAFGQLAALQSRMPLYHPIVDITKCAQVRKQVSDYFDQKIRKFDLPLAPHGTAFQHSVWHALQRIPFGKIATYGEIAQKIGRPKAARAVGRANATNPICLIVPCHRVIGSDGSLTGFAFGEAIKEKLLKLERGLAFS